MHVVSCSIKTGNFVTLHPGTVLIVNVYCF